MSTRVKFLALSGVLFSLILLMLNPTATTTELRRQSPASWAGIGVAALAIVSLVMLIMIALGWRDPFASIEVPLKKPFLYYIVWALGAIGIIVAGRYLGEGMRRAARLLNETNNTTVQGSAPVPAPAYYNNTTTGVPGREPLSSQYVLYLVLALLIVAFLYTSVLIYRDSLRKRKRKQMKLRAELFDRKLEELGLDMFKDPREAVVGIYKNAVLWLEYLGVPYRESWTHWEHAERVGYMHEAFVELTRLFEKAKYAPEKITWEDAERALEVYREMRRGVDEVQ